MILITLYAKNTSVTLSTVSRNVTIDLWILSLIIYAKNSTYFTYLRETIHIRYKMKYLVSIRYSVPGIECSSNQWHDGRYTIAIMKHHPVQIISSLNQFSGSVTLYFLPLKITMNICRYLYILRGKSKLELDAH